MQQSNIIDFSLEILQGCKWNCTGCNIQKHDQDGFINNDFDNLMRLFDNLRDNHYVLSNIAITPTDFMAASNGERLLTIDLKPMVDKFKAITLNTTFLQDRETIEYWATHLRPLLKGNTLKFSIPIEPDHYTKEKYMDRILKNRDYMVSLLPEANYTKSYLVGNLHEYKQFANFEMFSEKFHNKWKGGHLDLVITEGRLDMTNQFARSRLHHMVQYQNELYNNSVNSHTTSTVNFTYGKPHEGFNRVYVYKNSRIYAAAFVGEPLVVFDKSYSIGNDVEWNVATLIDFENQMMLESYDYLEQTHDCLSCEFANACTARGLIKLMKTLGVKDCLAPKPAFIEMRQVA